MAAHDGQVKRGSKKGLGQSQAVGKVGGVKWSGSRVTFQEEEAEGGQGEAGVWVPMHLHVRQPEREGQGGFPSRQQKSFSMGLPSAAPEGTS